MFVLFSSLFSTSPHLTDFLGVISSTLDSPSSGRPDEAENDDAISRLLSGAGENDEPDEEEIRAAQKAAKRARRIERERAEAAELAASGSQLESRPRRRRADELAEERLRRDRELLARRRDAEAALDDGEAEFVGSTDTAVGAAAVAKAQAAEATPAANFSKAELNDFMALKRAKGLEAMAERKRKLDEADAERASRKRAASPQQKKNQSPPKRAKQDGKKRLRRAADTDEEEPTPVTQVESSLDDAQPTEPLTGDGDGDDDANESPLPVALDDDIDMAHDDDGDDAPAPTRKAQSKKKARRIDDSDEDEENGETAADDNAAPLSNEGEGEPTVIIPATLSLDETSMEI